MTERELVAVELPIGVTYIGMVNGKVTEGKPINLIQYVGTPTQPLLNGNLREDARALYSDGAIKKLPRVQLADLERKVHFLGTINDPSAGSGE